ncbi:MAG: twin transmembrane helix small protein [Oceanicaulis sp.]
MLQFIDILLYILLALVFLVLAAGIYALFRGGDFGRTWSNRLMRARVLFQFIAVLVIVAGFWLKNQLAGG